MAILVDEARWPWRGTHYCHLVSDSDLDELHEFAGLLGQRRVGFQGDHYDIDVVDRDRAIELGAVPRTSREVVRALKSAGLRLRPSQFTKWELLGRADRPVDSNELLQWGLDELVIRMADQYLDAPPSRVNGVFALHRPNLQALIFGGEDGAPAPLEAPDRGVYSRRDRDAFWSLEIMSRPLAMTE